MFLRGSSLSHKKSVQDAAQGKKTMVLLDSSHAPYYVTVSADTLSPLHCETLYA